MTTIDVTSLELSETDHHAQLRRAVIASTVGTTIEWYDFLLYSTVTGLVFGKLFFPKSDPLVGVLEAFAVYTVGFIARPIGAMIFGHYGDRIGRKATLIATLLLTGLATFAVGFVPTYETSRHLGRRHPDHHPFHPGHWGRRRMGRLGPVVDGMGAHQPASRLHHVMAATGWAGRIAAGEHRGARVQPDLRRPIPRLGLAHPVHAQHRHGRGRAVYPARAFSRRPPSAAWSPKNVIERMPVLEVHQAPAEVDRPHRAGADGRAGAGLHLSRIRVRLRDPGSACLARFPAHVR